MLIKKDVEDANTLLATLIYQKQTLDDSVILKVDVENPDEGIETVVKKLQDFKAAYNELEVKTAIGADTTEAEQKVNEAIALLNAEDKQILANLGIDNAVYKMLPYLATMIILAFTSKKSRAPKAEGIPYDKGLR